MSSTQTMTFAQFAELLARESSRGIINGSKVMQQIIQNKIPKIIRDIRGDLRLAVERVEDGLSVTEYHTPMSIESIGEV